nr:MAG TPA_asm: hypothetical protein [Caudoviricetes sp.]
MIDTRIFTCFRYEISNCIEVRALRRRGVCRGLCTLRLTESVLD